MSLAHQFVQSGSAQKSATSPKLVAQPVAQHVAQPSTRAEDSVTVLLRKVAELTGRVEKLEAFLTTEKSAGTAPKRSRAEYFRERRLKQKTAS